MRKAIAIFGLAATLCQPIFSQEAKEPSSPGLMFTDPAKLANLQLDLLLEQRKTLEATASWLNAEQRLLNEKITDWEKSRSELGKHLNGVFDCKYDMDSRKCLPKPEEKPEEKPD